MKGRNGAAEVKLVIKTAYIIITWFSLLLCYSQGQELPRIMPGGELLFPTVIVSPPKLCLNVSSFFSDGSDM